MEKAKAYNNAGVVYLEAGHARVAWDLFKGALEVKLLSERADDRRPAPELSAVSDSFQRRADVHVQNLETYASMSPTTAHSSNLQDASLGISKGGIIEQCVALFEPYLCCRPLLIQHVSASESTSTGTSTFTGITSDERAYLEETRDRKMNAQASATIIFNLALVDHMHNRSSQQAISLYELATTLMVGEPIGSLGISLINNLGCWCFENGNVEGAQRCMSHLSRVLDECDTELITQDDRELLSTNIKWTFIPPSCASPAA